MAPLRHIMRMVRQILVSRFPYSRRKLLKSYLTLLAESVRYHLGGHADNEHPVILETRAIFGYDVKFTNYGQLLDMFEEIFILKAYEPVSKGNAGLILDCGANIGLSVLYFKMTRPQSQVIAFEPHLQTCEILNHNVANNGLTRIQIRQRALSDSNGITMLYGNARFTMNMSLDKEYGGYEKTFEQETLAELLSDFVSQPTFLVKLDVEGSELKIVENLMVTSSLRFVQNLIIEYHPEHGEESFIERVCAFGFKARLRRKGGKAKEALLYFWK